jgi:hypothetical protein
LGRDFSPAFEPTSFEPGFSPEGMPWVRSKPAKTASSSPLGNTILMSKEPKPPPPTTPDGRYFVIRGRLWRCSNPNLPAAHRDQLVHDLMQARRAKGAAIRSNDHAAREQARAAIDAAKQALGERGPVWWTDNTPDYNRHLAKNTPYAAWFAALNP